MSRASGKTKDLPDEDVADSDVDSEIEDVASNEAREETPDLYRNSSLGMYVLPDILRESSTDGIASVIRFGGVSLSFRKTIRGTEFCTRKWRT